LLFLRLVSARRQESGVAMYRAYQAFSYPVTFCNLQPQDNAAFEARLKMVHVQRAWEASKAIWSKDIVPVNRLC
jgi:quinol monooxygenase YgiN